ncbi:acid resistance transcriptional activator GadE [Escherichia coli]|nr:acid resistance transcriptional activator GadE [Escherichia coli]
MIFLMTKDSFLLQGFWQLKDNHEMIKINSLSEIKKVGNKPFKVIIDTYHNHILDEEAIKFLEKLDAERIIVLAPYHISKLKAKAPIYFVSRKAKAPIYFVSRKESIKNLLEITYGKHLPHKNSQLCFSHNQFKIMQLILKNKNESNITSTLNISQQTLKIQKFNIMYKLKLRRMSDIVTLGITSYF